MGGHPSTHSSTTVSVLRHIVSISRNLEDTSDADADIVVVN